MQSPSPARERARTTHQSIPVFPPSPPTGCLLADPTYSFALVHFSEQKRPISPCFEKCVIAVHLEKGVTARKSALFIKSSCFAVESKSHGNDLSSQFQFHPNKWPGQKNASRANPNSSSLPLPRLDENHLISGRTPSQIAQASTRAHLNRKCPKHIVSCAKTLIGAAYTLLK